MKKNISNYRIEDIRSKLDTSGICPLDVMITGVTGAGKSTTLNALFEKEVAKVGKGVDPETMKLDPYRLNDWLRLWDTPGLGDGKDADEEHKQEMVELLQKNAIDGFALFGFIDLAIIVIEGSKRDLGTTRTLLGDVILPNIKSNRVLVVINQADVAMKGRYWDSSRNCPEPELKVYLDNFAVSLQERIRRDTGLQIPRPIYYSAEKMYNIESFMDLIIDNIPSSHREPIDVKYGSYYTDPEIIGNGLYQYYEEVNLVEFSCDGIRNNSSWQSTGELQLVCWISDSRYSEDGWESDNHDYVGQRLLGHLDGGKELGEQNFGFRVTRGDITIKGEWYFVFTLYELCDDRKWYIVDWRNAKGGYN